MKFHSESFIGDGAVQNIELGFVPDYIKVVNSTKFATDGTVVESEYFKGMADGFSLNGVAEDTAINRSISSTNGFTVVQASSTATNQSAVSGISKANPAVVTVASTTGWTTDDVIHLKNIAGMINVNNVDYKIVVLNGTTFSLKDMDGNAIDSSAFEAYVAAADDAAVNLSLNVANEGFYGVTLGTAIAGVTSDVMFVTATAVN